jgi:hypothetical protein
MTISTITQRQRHLLEDRTYLDVIEATLDSDYTHYKLCIGCVRRDTHVRPRELADTTFFRWRLENIRYIMFGYGLEQRNIEDTHIRICVCENKIFNNVVFSCDKDMYLKIAKLLYEYRKNR